MMRLLFGKRKIILIAEEVVMAAAGNIWSGGDVMTVLFENYNNMRITEKVLEEAAGNSDLGKERMTVLLDRGHYIPTITEKVVTAAAGNWGSGAEVLKVTANYSRKRLDHLRIVVTDKVEEVAKGNPDMESVLLDLFDGGA